jgi:hypothetical protein
VGVFYFSHNPLPGHHQGKDYWVVLEGTLIFSLIIFFIYWGNAEEVKKNIEYFRNYLLGCYPRNVFGMIVR